MTAGGREEPVLAAIVTLLVCLKLALTGPIGILPILGPYDEMNYVTHAASLAHGSWFGPYDQLTLIKMPFFPFFLAGISKLGVALPVAHQLLYACAALVACVAVRPLLVGETAFCVLFGFVLFNPYTFDQTAWFAQRSQIAGSLALLSVACAAAMLVRRRARLPVLAAWSAGYAVSLAAFWLTREESVWIVPPLLLIEAAYVWALRGLPRRDVPWRLALALIAPVFCGAAVVAVALTNGAVYGWATLVETETPEFLGAFDSLARIAHHDARRLVPVPYESLGIAYRISPAARELRNGFDGSAGAAGRRISCAILHVCDEVGGGWFVWILRSAAASAGNAQSASAERAYFVRLSNEIDRACDERTIACTRKGGGLLPTFSRNDLPAIVENLGLGVRQFFAPEVFTLVPPAEDFAREGGIALYRAIAGDIVTVPVLPPLQAALLSSIAWLYRVTFGWLSVCAAAVIVGRLAAWARSRFREAPPADVILGGSVLLGVIVLVAILAVVRTYLFEGFQTEYFSAAFPAAYFAVGLIIVCETGRVSRSRRSVAQRSP